MIYYLHTLVDITSTNQHHGGDTVARNQQQNFETVLQTIGLCGNLNFEKHPVVVPATEFKQPKKTAWYFEWTMEHPEIFTQDGNHVHKLSEVFNYVPVITGLTETAVIDKPMFIAGTNIVFGFK